MYVPLSFLHIFANTYDFVKPGVQQAGFKSINNDYDGNGEADEAPITSIYFDNDKLRYSSLFFLSVRLVFPDLQSLFALLYAQFVSYIQKCLSFLTCRS